MNELFIKLLKSAKCVILDWMLVRLCMLGLSTDIPIEFLGKILREVPVSMVNAQITIVNLNHYCHVCTWIMVRVTALYIADLLPERGEERERRYVMLSYQSSCIYCPTPFAEVTVSPC